MESSLIVPELVLIVNLRRFERDGAVICAFEKCAKQIESRSKYILTGFNTSLGLVMLKLLIKQQGRKTFLSKQKNLQEWKVFV